MALLGQILGVTFPFFALVLCGFLAVRADVLPREGIPGLNSFVLYLALPCMLFRFAADTPLAQLIDPAITLTYLLCALPAVAMKPVSLLADAASPVALFTLGGVLARSYLLGGAAAGWRTLAGAALLVAAFKLLLHPLLVFAAVRLAIFLGLPLDPFAALVLVLVAALPSASNVPMLAERFGADAGRIAAIVLLTTALAFLSFSLAVAGLVPSGRLVA